MAPLLWEKSSLEKSNPNTPFWSLRCRVRSVSELNDPLITSGDQFWCTNSLGARRCQQESILLLASVRGPRAGDGGSRALRDCAPRAPLEESTGGRGGGW